MGWMSGKQPVYKFNPLRVTKSQQEDFLKTHLKMTPQKMKRFKAVGFDKNLLKSGRAMTESQFREVIKNHDSQALAKWQEYKKEMDKKYEEYQDIIRQENIKKTRQLDRKKETADEMIRKLTGKKDASKRRKRTQVNPARDKSMTAAEKRVLEVKRSFINPDKTDWQHAGPKQAASVYEAKNKKTKGEVEKEDKDDKGSDDDIENVKEKAKNLLDLQI